MDADDRGSKIRALRGQFPILAETPDVLERWFELVSRCKVTGKRCHDARLAAHPKQFAITATN